MYCKSKEGSFIENKQTFIFSKYLLLLQSLHYLVTLDDPSWLKVPLHSKKYNNDILCFSEQIVNVGECLDEVVDLLGGDGDAGVEVVLLRHQHLQLQLLTVHLVLLQTKSSMSPYSFSFILFSRYSLRDGLVIT